MNIAENELFQPEDNDFTLSRRSFLFGSVATGAFLLPTMLGRVFPASMVPAAFQAQNAYAAEAQTFDALTPGTQIRVVSIREVGFTVVDMRDSARTPVEGMEITITSRYNQKTVTGTTDSTGVVILDISELSEGYEKGADLKVYAFNGKVEAKKDGYRIFRTGLMRIQGAEGVAIPTRSLKEGEPSLYASLMTFNDYDIQYTTATFINGKKNNATHTITVELQECTDSGTLSLYVSGNKKAVSTQKVSPKDGVATVTFEDTFLKTGASCELPANGTFHFAFTGGKETYTFPCALAVRTAAVDDFLEGEMVCTAGDEGGPKEQTVRNISIVLPKKIPVIGGSSFDVWTPSMPFVFNVDPCGIIMAGIGSPQIGVVLDNGTVKSGEWEKDSFESVADQWEKKKSAASDMISRYQEAGGVNDPDDMAPIRHVKLMPRLEASWTFSGFVQGSYSWDDEEWGLFAQALAAFAVDAEITEQFVLGPVPVFIGLKFSIGLNIGLGVGGKFPYGKKITDATWDYKHTGLTFNIPIGIALTAGIGLSGVASVGVRGGGSISLFLGLTPPKDEGNSQPHVIVGASASMDIVIQVFIVKWSCRLVGDDWPCIFDNWEKKSLNASNGTADLEGERQDVSLFGSAETGTLYSDLKSNRLFSSQAHRLFEEQAVVVPNSELLKTAEFSASSNGLQASDLQGEEPVEEFSYQYTGKAVDAVCFENAIKGLHEDGGVIPLVDTMILKDVFSDPRSRIVVKDGVPYQFRIATVAYPGNVARSRLTGQKYDDSTGTWGTPTVIEFNSKLDGISRIDMFDYDFDVKPADDQFSGIEVLMTSGTRPNDDNTTYTQVCTNPMLVRLRINGDLTVKSCKIWRDLPGRKFSDGYHCFLCPRLVQVDGGSVSDIFGLFFLHRYASNAADVMTEKANVVLEFGYIASNIISMGDGVQLDDSSTYDIIASSNPFDTKNVAFACSIACMGSEVMNVYTVGHEKKSVSAEKDLLEDPEVLGYSTTAWHNVANAQCPGALKAWNGHGGYLYSADGKLMNASFDASACQPVDLQLNEVGPADFNIQSFGVSESGDYLLFANVQEGKTGQEYDADGNRTDITSQDYTIMASKLLGNRFSDAFPFAVSSHPSDSLVEFAEGGNSTVFLSSCITSMENSTADIYFTRVPHTICATPLTLVSNDPFVCAGHTADFSIAVRNDGNILISGFTVVLYDEKEKEVDRYQVVLADDHVESILDKNNFKGERLFVSKDSKVKGVSLKQDPLRDPIKAGMLVPGHKAMYKVKFKIPEDWEGTRTVSAGLVDVVGAQIDSMAANAIAHEAPTISISSPVDVLEGAEANTNQAVLSDAPVEKSSKESKPPKKPSSSSSNGSSSSSSNSGSSSSSNGGPNGNPNGNQSGTPSSSSSAGNDDHDDGYDDDESIPMTSGEDESGYVIGGSAGTPNVGSAPSGGGCVDCMDCGSIGPIAAAVAVLGAAGAGFAAYSARRTKLEEEARQARRAAAAGGVGAHGAGGAAGGAAGGIAGSGAAGSAAGGAAGGRHSRNQDDPIDWNE